MDIKEINNKYNTEFTNKLLQNEHIFHEIYKACNNRFDKGCGSYLFDGQTYKYCDKMYEKQELLYNSVKNIKTILEIGVYMGHSLFIMLLSNPNLKITCIDISNVYAEPVVKVLNKYFNNAITFIYSDSIKTLTTFKEMNYKFDFFHVDGHHENEYITKEFHLIKNLNNNEDNVLKIIFDDQVCLSTLINYIDINYNIKKKFIPHCEWNNIYYEIQL
jgi:hypothetical protein